MNSEYLGFWERFCIDSYLAIVNYARTLVNGDLSAAEDLAQMTIYRVLKYAPNPEGIKNRLAYVLTITKRIWIDSRKPKEVSIDELLESDPNNPALVGKSDLAAIFERNEDFERQIGPLTPESNTILLMRLRGFTWQEIADALGESISKTKFRWSAVLQRIHERNRDRSDQ